ncbi:MAG: GbsR/MarR family transcriptional regulator [Fidelibacterota bacterium]
MRKELTVEQKQLVEDFGNAYASFGQPRVRGRIVGLLLSFKEPLSLDDIVELIEVSKGPVSGETRLLEEFGLIRSSKKPGNRKIFYEITEHPFTYSARRNLWLIRRNQQIAESYLETENLDPIIRDRFKRMEEFHSGLHKIFSEFIDRWMRK